MQTTPTLFERARILPLMLRLVRVKRKPRFCLREGRSGRGAFARGSARVPGGRDAEHEESAFGVERPIIPRGSDGEDVLGRQTPRGLFVEAQKNLVRAPAAKRLQTRAHGIRCAARADEFTVGVPDGEIADDGAARLHPLAAEEVNARCAPARVVS